MRSIDRAILVAAAGLIGLSLPVMAQHETGNDIFDGERAFGDSCANCHGPDGDLIAGIDLGRGLYRRSYTDEELAGIIINGIPDTPMPPTPGMSRDQADRIVVYLRAMAAENRNPAEGGVAERGRDLYFGRGACDSCHAVNGRGLRHGPDLSRIGLERSALELESALLDPAGVVLPTGRSYSVTLANGEVVTGRLLNHDTFTVQLIDTSERLRSFVKGELRAHGFAETPMPAYGDEFSPDEIADLVSYLASLQGTGE